MAGGRGSLCLYNLLCASAAPADSPLTLLACAELHVLPAPDGEPEEDWAPAGLRLRPEDLADALGGLAHRPALTARPQPPPPKRARGSAPDDGDWTPPGGSQPQRFVDAHLCGRRGCLSPLHLVRASVADNKCMDEAHAAAEAHMRL